MTIGFDDECVVMGQCETTGEWLVGEQLHDPQGGVTMWRFGDRETASDQLYWTRFSHYGSLHGGVRP